MKESLGADLVFSAAGPIQGGREMPGAKQQLERGAVFASFNDFQGRYIIRHPWAGKIECQNPQRGVWSGPPDSPGGPPKTSAATNLASSHPRTRNEMKTKGN